MPSPQTQSFYERLLTQGAVFSAPHIESHFINPHMLKKIFSTYHVFTANALDQGKWGGYKRNTMVTFFKEKENIQLRKTLNLNVLNSQRPTFSSLLGADRGNCFSPLA